LAINLGLDPRKPNQSIKGVAKLPNGTGKKVRVAVFAIGKIYTHSFYYIDVWD
jgi:large subunit ribosomal protein L1